MGEIVREGDPIGGLGFLKLLAGAKEKGRRGLRRGIGEIGRAHV